MQLSVLLYLYNNNVCVSVYWFQTVTRQTSSVLRKIYILDPVSLRLRKCTFKTQQQQRRRQQQQQEEQQQQPQPQQQQHIISYHYNHYIINMVSYSY
jgi:transcription initiation factor TFIID subunit TAF12